jgi:hypothetical protein
MGDAGAAMRAAAYDAAYWNARYAKNGAPFEWFASLSCSPAAAGANDAETQLEQARPRKPGCCAELLNGC